nr:MAG: hypothetical protein [Microvirus sp.]
MKKFILFLNENKGAIASLLVALLAIASAAVGLTGCAGIVRATVHRPNDTSQVQINISTGNTTQDVSPDVKPDLDLSFPLSRSGVYTDTVYLAPRSPYPYQIRNEIVSGYRFSLRPIKKSRQGLRCKSNQN